MSKKTEKIFNCKYCEFNSNRKYNLKRHIDTKHKFQKFVKKTEMICKCGKKYKYERSFIRHKEECKKNKEITPNIENLLENIENKGETSKNMKEILLSVLGDYKELVLKAIEQPKIINNSQNIKNQQNNTTFSIKNYLNTECKNAMNLSDYVSQIKFTFDDLLYMKNHGIVKSFEKTFVKGLKEMDTTVRPIHCSDVKRGNFYVKDHDIWDKDNENEQIIKTLKGITDQQCDVLKEWKRINQDWLDNDIKQEYANVVTRKIVDIYGEKIQSQILNLLKQLNIKH